MLDKLKSYIFSYVVNAMDSMLKERARRQNLELDAFQCAN